MLSEANPKASSFVNCCQDGVGETGETWKKVKEYLQRAHPFLVLLENVTDLDKSVDDADSDAAYIHAFMASEGYIGKWMVCDATLFGSAAARVRLYYGGVYVGRAHVAAMGHMPSRLDNVLASMQIPQFPITDFLVDTSTPGLPEPDVKSGSDQSGANIGNIEEHAPIFKQYDLEYPPQLERVPELMQVLGGSDMGGVHSDGFASPPHPQCHLV